MNNQAVIDDAGPFEKMVSFQIPSNELEQAMNRASRRLSHQVNIPGFRPGRAPRRLVERRVGADRVRSDALDELVPTRVGAILADTEISPAVPPLLESTIDTPDGSVELRVRVTTWPRLEAVPDYRDRRIEVKILPPVSEEVAARLDRLRHMYAPLQTVDRAAEKGDFVVIDMSVTDGEQVIEALSLDGFSYEVGSARLTAELDEELLERRAGDRFEIEAPLPVWLGAADGGSDDQDPAPASGWYRIGVVEVQSRLLPDLDDQWASEYTGHDSLDDLREEMRGELAEEREAAQWHELVTATVSEAVSELEVELPDRLETAQTELFFRNHLVALEQANLDYPTYLEQTGLEHEQVIEGFRQRGVVALKSRILTESVIDDQGLVVEDAEAKELLDNARRGADQPGDAAEPRDEHADLNHIKSEMLVARAHAFLAMQVQPVDDQGEPVSIPPPARVKAWFEPPAMAEEIPNPGPDVTEPLYEAEVIG